MALVPAMLLCQLLWAQHASDTVFTLVEHMPVFGDCASSAAERKKCSDKALVQFISRRLEYPEEARAARVEGTVYVNFIVDETGRIQSPTLLMDIGNGCGKAALDVLKAMPAWEPGRQGDQPVKVKLNLPIHFSLRNTDQTLSEKFSITWGDIVGDTVTAAQLKRNLPFSVYVRSPEGDTRYVDELEFVFASRSKRQTSAASRGGINKELVDIVGKAKGGGRFTITASVQEVGRFIKVSRTFYVSG